ncbi:membrane metalloprotease [Ulvibacter antarcticus]|nr:membrane metalloprotease [Ulvibacter antarcticus]
MKRTRTKIIYILLSIFMVYGCKNDDNSENLDDFKAENRKTLGVSAEDLLSDDIYKSLTVELLFSESYRPTETAILNFKNFLNDRLNKPGGINFLERVIPEEAGAPFDNTEIREIEDKNREVYTVGDEISVYVYFANGKSANDTANSVTLGTAYMNTSIVIYEKTLMDIASSSPLINLADLETTALNHEFGHILGLVNIQEDDIHNLHEDTAHNKHCVIENCLMYFESNSLRGIRARFSGTERVAELDPLCIADLRAKGGK